MIETEYKPPARYCQYMAFDESVAKIVMFGGELRWFELGGYLAL